MKHHKHVIDMKLARVATQHRLASNDPQPADDLEQRRADADAHNDKLKNSGELQRRREEHVRQESQRWTDTYGWPR